MSKVVIFLLFMFFGQYLKVKAQKNGVRHDEQYIVNHARLAVEEMELYKIPASITLAQGILETGNGQSDLAQYGNNHFGIKCKPEWTGGRMYHDDDLKGECFRKYPSVRDSYRDHSLFLAERPYYKRLFLLNPKDYMAWAHGLKKSGYATNPKYAYILIKLIEKYNLSQFDHLSPEEVSLKLTQLFPNIAIQPENEGLVKNSDHLNRRSVKTFAKSEHLNSFPNSRIKHHPNGNIQYIEVEEGDALEKIAQVYGISLARLLIYNDLTLRSQLKVSQKIFLQPKKKFGREAEYIVKEGDTMYEIAQNNGVFLNELYKKNSMLPGDEPKIGDKIVLKGRKG